MSYTNLNNKGFKYDERNNLSYNGMRLSDATIKHREQLRHGIDDFTSFTWRGVDAWENFGAFILNNKGSLKFYNGPSYSNEYTKPQFESAAGQLTGVTFQVQKIDFTIGVYWINERDYRQLINWLNPYEINTLTFGFEPDYFYQVKLASVSDGPRHIVGKEFNINYERICELEPKDDKKAEIRRILNENKRTKYCGSSFLYEDTEIYRQGHVYLQGKDVGHAIDEEYEYYTEIKLTFEIQGTACAYHKIPYLFSISKINNADSEDLFFRYSNDNAILPTDLETPIKMIFDIDTTRIASQLDEDKDYILTLHAEGQYRIENEGAEPYYDKISLFTISFKNLSYLLYDNSDAESRDFNINGHLIIQYDSETGLLFLLNGSGDYFLLNTLTTASQGKKIVDSINTEKYMIAGQLNYYQFKLENLQFVINATIMEDTIGEETSQIQNPEIFGENNELIVRGRTNLI